MRTVVSWAAAGAARPGATARPNAARRIERSKVMFPPGPYRARHGCGVSPALPHPARAYLRQQRALRSPAPDRLHHVASFAVAIDRALGTQDFELADDFAAVAARHRGHELFEIP